MTESPITLVCATLTADAKGLQLHVPCYVARQERVQACMGSMARLSDCFSESFAGAGLVAIAAYDGIEQDMAALNLHPFEDAAGYLPSGHRFSIPGVYLRIEEGCVVARRERISLTQH